MAVGILPVMTPADLAMLRARHHASTDWQRDMDMSVCEQCKTEWPCDATRLLDILDRLSALLDTHHVWSLPGSASSV